MIVRHLHSEAVEDLPDQGKSIFEKLHMDLEEMSKHKGEDPETPKGPSDGMKSEPAFEDTSKRNDKGDRTVPRINLQGFRELKINGVIGGDKDCLSYTSLIPDVTRKESWI